MHPFLLSDEFSPLLKKPFQIHGTIKNYSWGKKGPEAFIPHWLGIKPSPKNFYAEIWFGAYPTNSSQIQNIKKQNLSLFDVLKKYPKDLLGLPILKKWGKELPILIKILDANQPLSIQTHPAQEQAKIGFKKENKQKIPLDSNSRTYKDSNEKTEQIIALTDFYALSQFLNLSKILKNFKKHTELNFLTQKLVQQIQNNPKTAIKFFYQDIMTLPQTQINSILIPWIQNLQNKNKSKSFSKLIPEYWILKADSIFCNSKEKDRGLIAFIMLYLVYLKPTQSLLVKPGTIHSYLEGSGIEIMTNSDNTLRCGLTTKPIQVQELLKALSYQPKKPKIIIQTKNKQNDKSNQTLFKIYQFQNKNNETVQIDNQKKFEILLIIKGKAELISNNIKIDIKTGQCLFVPATIEKYSIKTKQKSLIYRITV